MQGKRILLAAAVAGMALAASVAAALAPVADVIPVTFGALAVALVVVGFVLTSQAPALVRFRYVAAYRLLCLAYDARRIVGGWLFAHMIRTGAILQAFPGSVFGPGQMGFGTVGEFAFDGPRRALSRILKGTAANIIVGSWFTIDPTDGKAQPGGAGAIGGVLVNPKNYVSTGTAGVPLAPTLVVPAGETGELAYMGCVIVSLAAAVNEGDPAKYTTATGVIGSGAPGAGETAIPNSRFRTTNAAAGLAVLELTN